jgi:hypothetical protein
MKGIIPLHFWQIRFNSEPVLFSQKTKIKYFFFKARKKFEFLNQSQLGISHSYLEANGFSF